MKKSILTLVTVFTLFNCSVAQEIFDTSKIEQAMVEALEWQEAHPIYAVDPTDWTNGAYYTGVARAHQETSNQTFIAALKTMGHRNAWKPFNRFFHADDIAISYAYIYINSTRKDLVNLEPTDTFIQQHLFDPHPWREGIKGKDMQTLWWWCDALFMAPPVLASYAKLKNDEKYLDEMHKYYKQTYDLLYDKEEQLFARDVRFLWEGKPSDKKGENGKKIFWSRGNGWVIGGLALVLDDMPKDYKHRAFYENLYKEMAAKILALQPEDGLWRTSLLSPESFNHGEVSGSGFFTFALAWGVNNGMLDKDTYLPSVKKGWIALAKCQHENGMIGWVQNIGFDPRPADANSWQNYGTGAFLLAGSEVLKLKN
ncbi:glycoside hydrolase family 88/105 protein [Polaribacter glomeratus]|uniref:Family 88 glycosyl hydrolase n=1 Tax=Polaribacter glomeratus TaxID=102 RepID=A0A2S7WG27_9FLAO|nr:glycoside hydrolase family 88 protein [Polaribacter glomeratus]PQJ76588.1 family 88 glycosyl hydrolase [Polaribacter glomeratus]TXD67576.1 glycoside hydrolase family 88 protein [Polaribacter glomeratus]